MVERVFEKPVKVSLKYERSLDEIFCYSFETFGEVQAVRYRQKIMNAVETLSVYYSSYPPCRHIPTKTHKYRNIILDAHLLIYRVTNERIEVLDIVHQASSISKIRKVRSIRL